MDNNHTDIKEHKGFKSLSFSIINIYKTSKNPAKSGIFSFMTALLLSMSPVMKLLCQPEQVGFHIFPFFSILAFKS